MIVTHLMRGSLAAGALLGALAYTGASFAQSKPGPAGDATQFFDKGTALYEQSRWAEAEVQFQKAWDLRKSFDVAANLGDCEMEIGQNREAAEHLAFAVREFPLTGKAALRDRLSRRFTEARARVGSLKIQVSVKGAEIAIDGRTVGLAPLTDEVFVDPGAHSIEARLGEYETGRAGVDVAKGAFKEVTLALVKKEALPAGAGSANKGIVIGGGVIAGVAVVTGAVLLGAWGAKGSTVSSLQDKIRHEGDCASATASGDCAGLRSAGRSRATLGNAGLWMLVTGGAVGVATLIYGVAGGAKTAPPKSGWQVLPVAIADGGGLFAQGTF